MGGAAGCGEEVVGGVGGVEGFSDSGKEGWGWGGRYSCPAAKDHSR